MDQLRVSEPDLTLYPSMSYEDKRAPESSHVGTGGRYQDQKGNPAK